MRSQELRTDTAQGYQLFMGLQSTGGAWLAQLVSQNAKSILAAASLVEGDDRRLDMLADIGAPLAGSVDWLPLGLVVCATCTTLAAGPTFMLNQPSPCELQRRPFSWDHSEPIFCFCRSCFFGCLYANPCSQPVSEPRPGDDSSNKNMPPQRQQKEKRVPQRQHKKHAPESFGTASFVFAVVAGTRCFSLLSLLGGVFCCCNPFGAPLQRQQKRLLSGPLAQFCCMPALYNATFRAEVEAVPEGARLLSFFMGLRWPI